MKELVDRIFEILNESEEDGPSFGGNDQGSDEGSQEDSSNSDQTDSQDDGDSPSFGDESSSDGSSGEASSGSEGGNGSESDKGSEESDEQDDEKDKKDDSDDKDDEKEEEFTAKSFDDFLSQTKAKLKIEKVSSEPSLIFGSGDTKNHNKYKVTISNEKGNIWFYFWDSIYNTENNKKPTRDDVLSCFGMDIGMVLDGASREEFEQTAGYDKSDDKNKQKAYDGCQKMLQKAKKLFEENQIKELSRLSNEH